MNPFPRWLPWIGFGCGVGSLLLATPGTALYWINLGIGGLALAMNAWVLLNS